MYVGKEGVALIVLHFLSLPRGERERERERERDRQTDRQTDRQRKRETEELEGVGERRESEREGGRGEGDWDGVGERERERRREGGLGRRGQANLAVVNARQLEINRVNTASRF